MSKNLQDIYKIGDEVMVCNTNINDVWVKCTVVGYYYNDSILVDSDYEKCYGGSWSVPKYVRKLTKLDKALK